MGIAKVKLILDYIKKGIILENITSEEFLEFMKVCSTKEEFHDVIAEHIDIIINFCVTNYNLEDYMSLLFLREIPEAKDEINALFQNSINRVLSKKTLMFLMKEYKLLKMDRIEIESLFTNMLIEIKNMPSEESTVLLFDLCKFINVPGKLYVEYPIVATMIKSYLNYDINMITAEMFHGSSIIGYLMKAHNEDLVRPYIEKLLQGEEINSRNMPMIGGGGSSLVYKIGDLVLKLGENRNCRRVFINHRILQSYIRDLISKNDQDLFYVEVMRYIKTGDVTKEELEELKADLYRQFIIWDDAKLANCGVLPEEYTNDLYYEDEEHDMLATVIDNPGDREAFSRRKRRVVVLDNDNMHIDFTRCNK